MTKRNASPTMKDVAREAGVALGTVSKVVNGLPVGEPYRKKVEAAIEKLHYQVNSYAQGLKTKRTCTVALLIPDAANPFFAELISCINIELLKRKYRMLLCSTGSNFETEQEYVNMVQQNKVDGIIGLTYNPQLVVSEDIPFIAIDRVIGSTVPCIASDNFRGGQMAAEKLAELGCRSAAALYIDSDLATETSKRKAGFENGCLAKSLSYCIKNVPEATPMSEFEAFLKSHLHNGRLDFDGLFCGTDDLACAIIRILREMGLRVPEDVQVIGFDGVRMFGHYLCSTIVQPVADISRLCVDLLLQESFISRPPLICLPVTYAYGGTTLENPPVPCQEQK